MKFILLLFLFLLWRGVLFSQIQTTEIISDKCTGANSFSPASTGSSTATTVQVGRFHFFSTFYNTTRTYVEFDLSGIPANAVITDARLRLYPNSITGTPEAYSARITSPWVENTVSWSNQPTYSTVDREPFGLFEFGSSWLTGGVRNHVQKMVAGVYPNYGWMLYHNNETENANKNYEFRSDDYAGTDFDPRLSVSYYIPMSVSTATIVHESASGANNGSISPVLVNGPGGTYSYQWFNSSGLMSGKTSLNLTGVPYGWYGLRVASSVAGTDPFYYAFLVGTNCEEVSIEFNPGPDYIDDALLSGPLSSSAAVNNFGNQTSEIALDLTLLGSTSQLKTLFKSRLWLDEELELLESKLQLTGHTNTSSRSNAAQFKKVEAEWNEKIVTYSSMPATSSGILVNIPEMTSPTEVKNIDVLNFFRYWQENNLLNYGFLFELQLYNGVNASQYYYSSDETTSSRRPKVDFKIKLFNSECLSYSEMKRKLDGGYSYAMKGKLKFTMDEEYAMDDLKYLPFKIYDKNHLVLESSDINGVIQNSSVSPLPIQFSDNRWILDISTIPGITIGHYYILEVSNSKGDKRYLRFLYKK